MRCAYRHIICYGLAGLIIGGLSGSLMAHPKASARFNHLNEQITAHPNNQALYLQRAWLFIMATHYDEAKTDLQHADEFGPSMHSRYYNGLIHNQQQQYLQALSYFNQALAVQANNTSVLNSRAQAYIGLNNHSAALSDYRKILQYTPAPQPSHYLDTAKLVLSISDYQQALSVIDEGILRLGLNPQLQQYAVGICVEYNDNRQALTRHESLATIMHNNPTWYVEYAELLINTMQWQAAKNALDHAQHLVAQRKPNLWLSQLNQTIQKQLLAVENYL